MEVSTADFRAGPKEFAEPVTLSSTSPVDSPVAGTVSRSGFDLLTLRARRKGHAKGVKWSMQVPREAKSRNLRFFQLSTFPQAIVQLVGNRVDSRGARPS